MQGLEMHISVVVVCVCVFTLQFKLFLLFFFFGFSPNLSEGFCLVLDSDTFLRPHQIERFHVPCFCGKKKQWQFCIMLSMHLLYDWVNKRLLYRFMNKSRKNQQLK